MKKKIKISRKQWETIGKTSQWLPENDIGESEIMKPLVIGQLMVQIEFVFDASDFSAEEVEQIRNSHGGYVPPDIFTTVVEKMQEKRDEFEAQEEKPFSIPNYGDEMVNVQIV